MPSVKVAHLRQQGVDLIIALQDDSDGLPAIGDRHMTLANPSFILPSLAGGVHG
jgi:hypothetical protein